MSAKRPKTRILNIVLAIVGISIALAAVFYNGRATRGQVTRARDLDQRFHGDLILDDMTYPPAITETDVNPNPIKFPT